MVKNTGKILLINKQTNTGESITLLDGGNKLCSNTKILNNARILHIKLERHSVKRIPPSRPLMLQNCYYSTNTRNTQLITRIIPCNPNLTITYHLPAELFHPSPRFGNNICLGSVLANFLLPSSLLLWFCKVPLHRSRVNNNNNNNNVMWSTPDYQQIQCFSHGPWQLSAEFCEN